LDYFGGIVYEYSLADAVPEYLTPYDYEPIIVEMTAEELEEYQQESKKLASAAASDKIEEEVVEHLAMKRASIVKSAENKYRHLRRILQQIDNPDHLLVYTNPDQIDDVQRILNEEGIVHHKFTYHEDEDQRDELLEGFDAGGWDALVAMKCLDEGVDVPATRQAILMSNSGNPMQFIQRRGRVLRQAEGKDKATIYDMVVVPSKNPGDDVSGSERKLLEKELDRFAEFAENANNKHTALNVIDDIRVKYRI
jgi:superfamily II DNA or RNA helicase